MTLLQLNYFLAVCRAQNFTHAAASLHVTQPTVTTAVRELETEFGVRLIDRSNKSFTVTPEGEELQDMALHLLSYAEQIRLVMQDRAAAANRLSFGCPRMTAAAEFPNLFRTLHRAYPEIEVETSHGFTRELLPRLDNGQLQMLLIPSPPDASRYRFLVWRRSRYLFCVPETHPLAGRSSVSFADICHEPLISFVGDAYLDNFQLTQRYLEQGVKPEIVYRCNQISVMRELIRQGEGCGFLLEGVPEGGSGVVGLPLTEELPVTFYLVWSRESERFSAVQRALKVLRRHRDNSGPASAAG